MEGIGTERRGEVAKVKAECDDQPPNVISKNTLIEVVSEIS
jgi:hypothetical protein